MLYDCVNSKFPHPFGNESCAAVMFGLSEVCSVGKPGRPRKNLDRCFLMGDPDDSILISSLTFLSFLTVLFLDWINNRLILTNLKVTRQRGIIGKTIMDIGLDRIQDMKVSFGMIGRIFGSATLEIESAGTFGKMAFNGMPSPRRVKYI